jgi:DNA-binding transcriptional LysR family regulator
LLARKRSVRLAALSKEAFVLFPRHLAPEFHDQLIAMCIRAGFSPEVRGEGAEYQTILSLVAAGIGVSLVPTSVRNLGRAGVSFLSLPDVRTTATVVLAVRRDHVSAGLRQFVEVARAVAQTRG